MARESEGNSNLQVTKVNVKDGAEFGRHFCSEVHAVEVSVKIKVWLEELEQMHPFNGGGVGADTSVQ